MGRLSAGKVIISLENLSTCNALRGSQTNLGCHDSNVMKCYIRRPPPTPRALAPTVNRQDAPPNRVGFQTESSLLAGVALANRL